MTKHNHTSTTILEERELKTVSGGCYYHRSYKMRGYLGPRRSGGEPGSSSQSFSTSSSFANAENVTNVETTVTIDFGAQLIVPKP